MIRFAGANRYGTAANMSSVMGAPGGTVFIATGSGFALTRSPVEPSRLACEQACC